MRLFADDRESLDVAYAGDVVGLANPGAFAIGDTLYEGAPVALSADSGLRSGTFRIGPQYRRIGLQVVWQRHRAAARRGSRASVLSVGHAAYRADSRGGRRTAVRGREVPAGIGVQREDASSRRCRTRSRCTSKAIASASRSAQLPSNAKLVEDWDGRPAALFESEWSVRLAREWNPQLQLASVLGRSAARRRGIVNARATALAARRRGRRWPACSFQNRQRARGRPHHQAPSSTTIFKPVAERHREGRRDHARADRAMVRRAQRAGQAALGQGDDGELRSGLALFRREVRKARRTSNECASTRTDKVVNWNFHMARQHVNGRRRSRRRRRGSPASRIGRRSLRSRDARRALRRAASSSSARTCSAWAPSSFAARTTSCRRSTPAERQRGVVAFSSGNHAQGVALAARLLGIPATIVMPSDAPAVKLAATRGYGAEIVLYEREQLRIAKRSREASPRERGATLVPPFDDARIVAGAGTAALELLEDAGPLDAIVVPLGGGGLMAGTAIAAHAVDPAIAIYGVEPQAGDDFAQSLARGERVSDPGSEDDRRRLADDVAGRADVRDRARTRARRRDRERRRAARRDALRVRAHEARDRAERGRGARRAPCTGASPSCGQARRRRRSAAGTSTPRATRAAYIESA